VGEIVNAQDCAADACVTTELWPAMTMLPVRSAPPFDETVKLTEPFPLPDSGEDRLIQPTSVVAVHPHSLCVATVTPPASAPALTL